MPGSRLLATLARVKSLSKSLEMDSYIWIDLEMTGLDLSTDTILEAACVITKPNLNPVHEGIRIIINQPEEVLKAMNSWSKLQHEKTGLVSECRKSKVSLSEAEQQLSDYIKRYTSPDGIRYIAGNSVYMDKFFLEKYMPSVNELLHYRVLDVSTLKILCQHWYPEQFSNLKTKNLNHRAFDDIFESLEELKEYKKKCFKS